MRFKNRYIVYEVDTNREGEIPNEFTMLNLIKVDYCLQQSYLFIVEVNDLQIIGLCKSLLWRHWIK